jgi:hypothetical protein
LTPLDAGAYLQPANKRKEMMSRRVIPLTVVIFALLVLLSTIRATPSGSMAGVEISAAD